LGVSLAAILCCFSASSSRRKSGAWERVGLAALACLAGWMLLGIIPLPPSVVATLAPDRWDAVLAVRRVAGGDLSAWTELSLAPVATFERLLFVVPAIAAFLTARRMGTWWRATPWIALAPIIAIAGIESFIGLAQFWTMRAAGGTTIPATGTYVNRNHFAGLLEMALPLALIGAVWIRQRKPVGHIAKLLGVAALAACLFLGIVVSLSRTGFAVSLAAIATLLGLLLLPGQGFRGVWKWALPVVLPAVLFVWMPTSELESRFTLTANEDVSTDTRVEIWRDTLHMIAARPVLGSGLGAYERGLYPFKTAKPTNTVDFAHNDYLQVTAELGLPGALLLACVAVWVLWSALRAAFQPQSKNREIAIALLGSFVAIGLHSLTDFNLYIPANGLVFAWLGGLAASPGLFGRTQER
jgi:O-antigen ligase